MNVIFNLQLPTNIMNMFRNKLNRIILTLIIGAVCCPMCTGGVVVMDIGSNRSETVAHDMFSDGPVIKIVMHMYHMYFLLWWVELCIPFVHLCKTLNDNFAIMFVCKN